MRVNREPQQQLSLVYSVRTSLKNGQVCQVVKKPNTHYDDLEEYDALVKKVSGDHYEIMRGIGKNSFINFDLRITTNVVDRLSS